LRILTFLILIVFLFSCNFKNDKLKKELKINIEKQADLFKEKSNYYETVIRIIEDIQNDYLKLFPNEEFTNNFSYKNIDLDKIKKKFPNEYNKVKLLFDELYKYEKDNGERIQFIEKELVKLKEQEKKINEDLKK
jgi:hypothetical protein